MNKITKQDVSFFNEQVKSVTLHPNGCIVRRTNHRLSFGQSNDETFVLQMELYDKDLTAEEVSEWREEVIRFKKGKATVQLLLSKSGAIALYTAVSNYLQEVIEQ